MKYPVDPETGMPYGIAPAAPPSRRSDCIPTDHHVFYNRENEHLQDQLGGAVRVGRVLSLSRWIHENIHKIYSDGLESYPDNDQAKFGTIIYEAAGYLPREALVRQRSGLFKLELVNDMIYSQMRSRLNMHPQCENDPTVARTWPYRYKNPRFAYEQMSRAAITYITEQDMGHLVGLRIVEDYIYAKNGDKQRRLGKTILNEAVQTAVQPFKAQFKKLHAQGLMRLASPDPFYVVKNKLLQGDISSLNQQLASYLKQQIENPSEA